MEQWHKRQSIIIHDDILHTSQHYWAAEEAMTVYPALVSGAVGELRFHCRWKKEETACDKKINLWCSQVQSGGGLDSASHSVLIRRTFQRIPVASQGLLQLSSRKGINIPPGLSGNFRESSPQKGYSWLWREFLPSWQKTDISNLYSPSCFL